MFLRGRYICVLRNRFLPVQRKLCRVLFLVFCITDLTQIAIARDSLLLRLIEPGFVCLLTALMHLQKRA